MTFFEKFELEEIRSNIMKQKQHPHIHLLPLYKCKEEGCDQDFCPACFVEHHKEHEELAHNLREMRKKENEKLI